LRKIYNIILKKANRIIILKIKIAFCLICANIPKSNFAIRRKSMKKLLIVEAAFLAAGCASDESCSLKKTTVEAPVVEETPVVEAPAPCPCQQQVQVVAAPAPCPCQQAVAPCPQAPCACSQPSPCREIQRPRIREEIAPRPRRNCPTDGQTINCGCGNYKTFEQPVMTQPVMTQPVYTVAPQAYTVSSTPVVREVIPAMPEAYVLASNRVVSRFFKDASSVYAQKPNVKLYVRPARALSADLPAGVDKGAANFKNQVAASYTFDVVEDPAAADYSVETTAEWFDTPSKSVPAILYSTALYDRQNNKVKEWVEVIKKADNTKSWL
jgi:hypothetical protein